MRKKLPKITLGLFVFGLYFCSYDCPLVLFVYTVRLQVWTRQLETYLLNDSAAKGPKARDLDILTSGSPNCLCTNGQSGLLLLFCLPFSVFIPRENRMQAGRSNYLDCHVLIFLLPKFFLWPSLIASPLISRIVDNIITDWNTS